MTINLEKIKILNLTKKTLTENPICPNCGKHLKSMGKNQGMRCEKCGKKYYDLKKAEFFVPRTIKLGLYLTSTRSQRHLTKPLGRYGQEKHSDLNCSMINGWHFP